MNELKLHDIKELTTIPDYTFFIFIFLCALGIAFFLLLIYLVYKFLKNRKKNFKKEYFKILKEVNTNNAKKASYTITKYARLLANNEREQKLCNELIEELEQYKYKKEIQKFSSDSQNIFDRFMDSLDV